MTVLLAVTSVADVIEGDLPVGVSSLTTASAIAPYVKEGIAITTTGVDIPLPFTAGAERWFSFYHYTDESGMAPDVWWQLNDDANSRELFRLQSDSLEQLQLQYYDGATWQNTGSPFSLPVFSRIRVDIHVNIADSGGNVEVFFDNVSQVALSGDTLLNTSTTADTAYIGGAGNAGDFTGFSALIVADEDTRAMVYEQLLINGAGSNSDFTGAYTDIDELGFNDVDFINADTDGHTSTFAIENHHADFNTGYDVVTLGVNLRGADSSGTPKYVKPCCYEGVTLGEAASVELGSTKRPARGLFATNPDTATAWTPAEINTAEIGAKASLT